jgi:hypothetical protein
MLALVAFWIAIIDLFCWAACFWLMYRISTRQDAMLAELREQARRIERVSVEEHRLVKELHPTVSEIKSDVGEVARAVKE